MDIEFDDAKSAKNEKERGLPFWMARDFDFQTAVRVEDKRRDYGESRVVAYGYLYGKIHVFCFKPTEYGFRVISLRRANKREERKYDEAIKTLD